MFAHHANEQDILLLCLSKAILGKFTLFLRIRHLGIELTDIKYIWYFVQYSKSFLSNNLYIFFNLKLCISNQLRFIFEIHGIYLPNTNNFWFLEEMD